MRMPHVSGGFKAPKTIKPATHIARPPKIHPAAHTSVRLPDTNFSPTAPAPYEPGVGKI